MANNVPYEKKFKKSFQATHFKQNLMGTAHPGFAAVQSKIAGQGYGKKAAGAILANASRKASPKAKKANPQLKNVDMPKKSKLHYKRT